MTQSRHLLKNFKPRPQHEFVEEYVLHSKIQQAQTYIWLSSSRCRSRGTKVARRAIDINIAAQKLISADSKSPHFDAREPTAQISDTSELMRDEIGLVHAVSVKERSSSKRKTLFKTIQLRHNADPPEIAKMWIHLFSKLPWTRREKRTRLAALQLIEAEWKRVDLFLNLLAYAEESQHTFSSDLNSTLHLALPALETLHADWTKCAADSLYSDFAAALEQVLGKVDEYYQKTSNSNALLDPAKKLAYFRAHWPAELQDFAVENMEETFKQRCLELHNASSAAPDDETTNGTETYINPRKPSLVEYQQYLSAREVVPEGMDTIQ
ncbi:hypothetical protein C8J57DRAFT_1522940 [Mycena rebaudengoi]|nr:hypothetical protein C8J57DRAFT_1522940 [Mycena rebaudengoi]